MTKLPKLAIVGRPNVGKSALFNRIANKKIAIVDDAPGITRDRLYSRAELFGYPFELIDTGGIDAHSDAPFNEEIKRQAEIAIEEADSIIMVVDAHIGITELDAEIARILLKTKKPLCLAVNKIDNLDQSYLVHTFDSLGIKKKIGVSAIQGWHIAELLEAAFEERPIEATEIEEDTAIKIAIVGRPNVGKSSLVNYLLDEERCIVSPIAGTTRDSVDIPFIYEGTEYKLIDTAGIRRKSRENEVVDKFAYIRTERAIERADVCILMLDAQQGMTTQEKRIANMIEEAGKGCILVFNKWDLVKGFRMEHCLKEVEEDALFLKHCPKIFMSAKTGRNVNELFPHILEVYNDSKKRITTHQLNKFIESALQRNHPPMLKGKRLRIYYMAQVDVNPPRFIFFVNVPELMVESYRKYLYNQFRETYGFKGVPILFHLRGKPSKEERGEETAKPPKLPKYDHSASEADAEEIFDRYDDEDEDDVFVEGWDEETLNSEKD